MKRFYQLIVLSGIMLFGCSKTSDKEYMQTAADNVEKGNVSEAISNYQKIVEEYPESDLAPEALLKQATLYIEEGRLHEAISNCQKVVDEYPESDLAPEAIVKQAALYHENKVKNMNQADALTKAADLFISVSEKYPESDQAPSSLFMAGFIFANDIQDFTKAKAIYNVFLQKYPDDDLSDDAKEELENMGLTPEEILEKKISAQGNND